MITIMSDEKIHPDADITVSDSNRDEIVTRIERAFCKVKNDSELKELRLIVEEYYLGAQL